ncbi:MAG: class I SAM-dependent rRNA methyltransferase [Pirellulaceae bacterium]|nr:class I SAM-dependent rRNA methyltransferase [Pirellulaceae bacterium]
MTTAPEAALPLSVARVVLRAKKALPFFGRHPWVRDSAVHRIEPLTIASEHLFDPDGQVVDLVTDKCKFIARGFYNSKSRIRVRLYTWSQDEALDEAFFRRKIAAAIELRRQIGYEPADETRPASATRLIFSESDGLSGLVVDRYGDYLVVQITSLAIAERLEMIVGVLQELLSPRAIVLRTEKSMAQIEGVEFTEGKTWGELPEGTLEIREHGLSYQIDLHEGQKTGFYLDQRENRRAVAGYLRGRRVLDMFCYTGGFAMCAAALGGATEVLGVDSSKKAIAQARANVERNNLRNVGFDIGDGFQTLDALISQGAKFDAVILDPPKFARNRSGLNGALMAYHRLNRTAVELLSPGGILVTCSCSGSVSREDFSLMLSGVAQKTGRDIQVLEERGAAADHPVSVTCLETAYLKCLVCRVS